MRRKKNHIGRLRIAAANILSDGLGFTVYPEDIVPATGRHRSDWRQDVFRWEVFTHNGRPFVFHSWVTLTEFVKKARIAGFQVDRDDVIWPNQCPPASPVQA